VRLVFTDSLAVILAPPALLNHYHLSRIIRAMVLTITANINLIFAPNVHGF
jgi:hypothetical protein